MVKMRVAVCLGFALFLDGTARAWVSTQAARGGYGIGVAQFENGDLATSAVYFDVNPSDMGVARVDGATGAILWRQDLGTPGADGPLGIAIDRDGNVITMNSSSPGVIKLDGVTGQPLWQTAVPGNVYTFAVDPSGDVVVGGSFHSGPDYREIVTKYSGASGAMVWTILLSGTYARSIAIDANGDVFVASGVHGGDGSYSTLLRALSGGDGHGLWELSLPVSLPQLESPAAVELDGNGRLVALLQDNVRTGSDEGLRPGDPGDTSWWAVVSADASDGTPLWRTEIHAPTRSGFGVSATALATGPDGTVYASGGLGTPQSSSILSFAVVALDGTTGAENWRHILGGPLGYFSFANDVAVAPDGSVIAAGRVSSKKASDPSRLFVTSLRARDGHAIWENALAVSTPSAGSSGPGLAVDPSGGISAVGYIYEPFVGNFPAVVKLRSNGTDFGGPSLGVTPRPVVREIKY